MLTGRPLTLIFTSLLLSSCNLDQDVSNLATEGPSSEPNKIRVMMTEPDSNSKSYIVFSGLSQEQIKRADDFGMCFSKLSDCASSKLFPVLSFTENSKRGFVSDKALFFDASKYILHLVDKTKNFTSLVSVNLLDESQGKGSEDQKNEKNNDDPLVPNPEKVSLTEFERGVIYYTNQARVQRGLKALVVQKKIMISSRKSSEIMKKNRNLKHGYTHGWSRENIAMGQRTPELVVRAWINSPGHYRNMMARNIRYIGVGDSSSQGGSIYWTQQFN